MRPILVAAIAVCAGAALYQSQQMGVQPDGSILIPTGQRIRPAGVRIEVNDRPLGMVISPDGKLLAVTTGSNFAPRRLHLIEMSSKRVIQSVDIDQSFVGVTFDRTGQTLYVGGGRDNDVKIFTRRPDGTFQTAASIPIPGSAPSGLALSPDNRTLYAALNLKHAVAVIDVETRRVNEIPVGSFPYTVALAGGKVYVSNWGGRRPRPGDTTYGGFPVVLDPRTGIPSSGTVTVIDRATSRVVGQIDTGLHPSALAVSPGADRVYVANANSDTVSVLDTRGDRVIATLATGPWRSAPLGSSPNALAVSADGKTLYVANGANNAIAIVRPYEKKNPVRGFIPTGWYPTAVTLGANGRELVVASGYGLGSIAPPAAGRRGHSFRDRVGLVTIVDLPGAMQLRALTRQVMANNGVGSRPGRSPMAGHPVPMDSGEASPIRYVFYIIKENRTYDQVLGDVERGNGDPSLVQFGRDVTPNHHALAANFVLLDNYYTPADQSALGHRWCTQGYASDWLHKYGNGRNDANPMLFAPTDFLWDNALAHGLSVRAYGERGKVTITPATAGWSEIYQAWKTHSGKVSIEATPVVLGLRPIYHPRYPGFSTKITDQWRVDEFLPELAGYDRRGDLPRLMIMLLPQNHTAGTAPGYPTPRAMVADNDLALGRVIEAISHSRYWKQSAIFITEDDAQDGLDHVEGHRTVGFIISPWTQRKAVDSSFYTTINMYRTIEQILGLPPSNQFDLAAEPMFAAFSSKPDFTPYTALPNRIRLDEMNPPLKGLHGLQRELAVASSRMDFDEPDSAPEQVLNRAIWHSVRGFSTPYPSLR